MTDLIGARWPITIGMLLLAAAFWSFSILGVDGTFLEMLPGMLIGGVGMGLAMGPMTTAALSTFPVDRAGVASGVVPTSRQVGGSLGVALTEPSLRKLHADDWDYTQGGARRANSASWRSAWLVGKSWPE